LGTGEANDTRPAPDEGSQTQRAKRRRRPYKYPTLERTSKDGRLEFTAPSHAGLRGWILDHESLDTEPFLTDRSRFTTMPGVLLPWSIMICTIASRARVSRLSKE